jgi:glucokinase
VWAPNIGGWDDYPLLAEVRQAVGAGVPVAIDSDRACSILGEAWLGAARGCRNAVFVAVGTGIGAGILVEGRVLRGHGDVAGAVGWMALDRPFRSGYRDVGCFEYHASGDGLARVARDMLAAAPDDASPLRARAPASLTAHDVFAAAAAGDALAAAVLDQAVGYWGMAAANLVSLFNPEVIVFGGGLFGPAVRLLDRIRAEATLWAQPIGMGEARLEGTALAGDAALYGAARVALAQTGPPLEP